MRFAQAYPHVQLRVTTLGSDRAFKVLLDGLVDFAVIMRSPSMNNRSGLVVEDLYREPVQVLLTKDHPLASPLGDHMAGFAWCPPDCVQGRLWLTAHGAGAISTARTGAECCLGA